MLSSVSPSALGEGLRSTGVLPVLLHSPWGQREALAFSLFYPVLQASSTPCPTAPTAPPLPPSPLSLPILASGPPEGVITHFCPWWQSARAWLPVDFTVIIKEKSHPPILVSEVSVFREPGWQNFLQVRGSWVALRLAPCAWAASGEGLGS